MIGKSVLKEDNPRLLPGPQMFLVLIDGLGDRKIRKLGNKTPLESARRPIMNKMAREGTTGYHYPLEPGLPVGSGIAHHLLFGYDLNEYEGRGVFEALGSGFELKEGDLAFRVNFATLGNRDVVIDRRAGRKGEFISDMVGELNDAFKKNPFKLGIELKHSYSHRGALVVRGWTGGANIPDMDPQVEGLPLIFPKEEHSEKLVKWIFSTSRKVMEDSEFNRKRKKIGLMPANALVLRGAGIYKKPKSLESKTGLRCLAVAKEALYLGAAKFAGMDTLKVELDEEKIPTAIRERHKYDFFFIHFKETDVFGHDGKPKEKRNAIAKIDSFLKPLLKLDNASVAVTGDHATPCILKTHSGDLVPILFWGLNVPRDATRSFGETECLKGGAGQLSSSHIIQMLANYAGRMPEVGK